MGDNLIVMELDLADLESIDEFVETFKLNFKKLDILLNNAGVGAIKERATTKQNIELNFGINHIGHFYLTQKLTPLMSKSEGITRVINVASTSAWLQAPRNLADWLESEDKLNDVNEYKMMRLYGLSKASNVMYSRAYTQRYGASNNIFAISLHPG